MLQFFYKIKVSYKHAIPNEHTSRSSKASIQDSLRAGPLLNPALSPAIAPNTSATHAKDRAATPGELVLEATRNLEKMKHRQYKNQGVYNNNYYSISNKIISYKRRMQEQ